MEPHERKQPSWYWILGLLLLGSAVASTVGVYQATNGLKTLCQVASPIFILAVGNWVTDFYFRRDANQKLQRDVKNAAYGINVMLHGVHDIDSRLAAASNALNEGRHPEAHREVYSALAVIRVTVRQAYHSLREWQSLSTAGADATRKDFEQDDAQIGSRQQIAAVDGKGETQNG